ncbi:MAG: hypothetical protein IT260_18090 [Saprospiraceae bacterium]|nr:hypothetical protein [Saprospiraceae bacterium]
MESPKNVTGESPEQLINTTLDLLDKAFDGLIARTELEEPFSGDLTEGIAPTLKSLRMAKASYIKTASEHVLKSGKEAVGTMNDLIKSSGINDLLEAAIVVGKPPMAEFQPTKTICFKNNVKRIPWLEIIKEIIDAALVILSGIFPIPGWLLNLIHEILNIIDKFLGGMPHEDLSTK